MADRLRAAASQMSIIHTSSPQTRTGWQDLCRAKRTRPRSVTREDFATWTAAQQLEYSAARISYHSSLNEIVTPQMDAAYDVLTKYFESQPQSSFVARPGILLTGQPFAGKSTILTTWARQVESALRDGNNIALPASGEPPARLVGGAEYLPVAYFSLSSQLNSSLRNGIRFYDDALPIRKSDSDLLLAILSARINDCGTRVVLLDQVQEIGSANSGAVRISGAIKHMMDQCPNTLFVGAGIGLETLGILSDEREHESLGQTGSRFALHPIKPFELDDHNSASDFARLLKTFESSVLLFDHQAGDIVDLATYIYERTGGLTGSIMKLLHGGCNEAITSGNERITEAALKRVPVSAYLDMDSGHLTLPEHASPRRRRKAS